MAALENSQRIYPCMYMNFIELCGHTVWALAGRFVRFF